MADDVLGRSPRGGGRLVRRVTAAAMVLIGLGNAVLGALVVLGVGSLLEVAPATGWGLLVAGPLLAALGGWLWVGGVAAARVGLVVVVGLLLANALAGTQAEGAPARTGLLILLAVGCVKAARPPSTQRRSDDPAAVDPDRSVDEVR